MKKLIFLCLFTATSAFSQNIASNGNTWYKINSKGKFLTKIKASGHYAEHEVVIHLINENWNTAEVEYISEYNYNHNRIKLEWGFTGSGASKYMAVRIVPITANYASSFEFTDVINPNFDYALEAIDASLVTPISPKKALFVDEWTGNVGIGTTMPESILQLGNSSTPNSSNFLTLGKRVDTEEFNLPFIGHDALSVKNDLGLGSTSTNGGINFYTGNGNAFSKHLMRMRILANGNIGIGTTNPSEKLDVNGLIRIPAANNNDNNSPGIVLVSNDDFLYDGQYINHYGFGFHGFQDGSTTSAEPVNSYMSGYFGVDFFTSGQNRMRISRDGIVSIGTVNRQIGYKLAVNGNIKAKEIKVETGWADFVFNKNYNLPTLTEVEQHIKEKGHLKDIPSAEEVAKNGILLGDMNAKLLQKIEELTLYTIEQEKKIESQNKTNQELKDRLLKLEQLVLNK